MAFVLGGLLGKNVALEGLTALDGTAGRTTKRFAALFLVFIFGMTTPLFDGYGCAVGQLAITRPSKPTPLGMQTA